MAETKKGYYYFENLEHSLKDALRASRQEPGLSLRDVAKIITKVYKPEEVKSLIKELK